MNIFCDKLIYSNNQLSNKSNELILKLTNLIGSNCSFMILSNLIKYKNNKLKNIIIDIIIKIYEESNIGHNILTKSLKNLVILYLENDLNFRNKLAELLKKIYSNLGEKDFNEYIKNFSFQQKEELLSNILDKKNNNDLKDNIKINNNGKRYSNSEQKRIKYKIQTRDNSKCCIEKEIYNNFKNNRHHETYSIHHKTNNNINNNNYLEDSNKYHKKNNTSIFKNKIKKEQTLNYTKKRNHNNSINLRKINKNFNINIIKKNKKPNILNNSINKRNLNKTYKNISPNQKYNINLKCIKTKKNINDILFEEIKYVKKNNSSNDKLEDLLSSIHNLTLYEDFKKKMECIINIHNILYTNYSENKDIIIDKIDIIMNSLIISIKKYFDIIFKDIISLKYLTNTFSLICSIKDLLKNISFETENKLINLIFDIVLFKNIKELGNKNEGLIIFKSFNSIMGRIIDFCNHTNTISILIRQIINNKDNNIAYNECCIRCLEKITDKMKEIYNEINIPEILFEINKFLVYFNINEEILESSNINEYNAINIIKKLISSIAINKKENIYKDYNIYINNKINGQDGIIKKNLIKSLIDNNIN